MGATYTSTDGYVNPQIAARNATCAVLSSDSVDLFEMCEVRSIEERNGRYALETVCGTFEAERVVDAGGPRGARVGAMVGVEVPVMAVRHQIVTFPTIAEGRRTRSRCSSWWARATTRGPRSRALCWG